VVGFLTSAKFLGGIKKMKWLINLLGSVSLIATLLISPSRAVLASTPEFDKNNFSDPLNIDNPYFPLKSETKFIFEGTTEDTPTSDEFVVKEETKTILGIKTRVIRDTAFEDGVLIEKTYDYFAQDDDGNVWYFGEDTAEYDPDGNVTSREGSWRAGVDGAEPGIVMEADPQVGDKYFQEQAGDIAQDQAKVLSVDESVCVPYGCFENVVETRDFTELEPDLVEHKYYAPNVGFIKSVMTQGGSEDSFLVKIVHND
jgi:hypothetical protein